MKPSVDELTLFVKDRKSAAKHYGVSEKTIVRWMQSAGLYEAKENFGVKLDMQTAQQIRKKYNDGTEIKDLASEYKVTFSTISRIIHNITYPERKDVAIVKVIYNPY